MAPSTGTYQRGYMSKMTKHDKQMFQRRFCEKSLIKGSVAAMGHLAVLFGAIGTSYLVLMSKLTPVITCLAFCFCVLVIIRQQRALENIVHFGSHNNFTRQKRLNDFLTNLLAAWPMMQDVSRYRGFHQKHHVEYGSEKDPCRARLEQIGVPVAEIDANRKLFMTIVRWFPDYVVEYYREVRSSRKQTIFFLAWHLAIAICAALLVSIEFALFQAAIWLTCQLCLLPFLRSVAELSEHDYERGENIAETTFNNLRWLDHLLIHPAGDAWHALHHLYPSVSWWKQRQAHKFLLKHDPSYQAVISRTGLINREGSERSVLMA